MSDNESAKKKLENMEKARRLEEERKERIKAQKLRAVDTSDSKSFLLKTNKYLRLCSQPIWFRGLDG
jgi:hypothetical protein